MSCQAAGACCPDNFIGFCLSDGTPISIVVQGALQTGWINLLTGIFTPGPPPAGTTTCAPPIEISPLDCAVDSITVCPPVSGLLDCDTDSITVCQPVVSANVSNVAGTNLVSVVILAANPLRKGAILYNDSSNSAFVKFGATASSTSFTIRMNSQTYYELVKGYVGVIEAIWQNSANGAMRITEFT